MRSRFFINTFNSYKRNPNKPQIPVIDLADLALTTVIGIFGMKYIIDDCRKICKSNEYFDSLLIDFNQCMEEEKTANMRAWKSHTRKL